MSFFFFFILIPGFTKRPLTKKNCPRITVSEDLVQSKNLSASSLLMPLSDHNNATTPGSSGYVSAYSRDGKLGDGEAAPCGTLIYHYAQQATKPEVSPSVTPCAVSTTASSYASPLSGITSLPSTATADDGDDDDNMSIISYNSYVDVDGVRTNTTVSSPPSVVGDGARLEEGGGEVLQIDSEDDYEVVEGSEGDSTADEL